MLGCMVASPWPVEKNEEESRLTYFNAGWAGEPRDWHVPPSVLRKVQSFVQQRPCLPAMFVSSYHVDQRYSSSSRRSKPAALAVSS